MNKDEIAGLVERLMSKVFGNLTPGAIDHADLDGMAFLVEDAADALTTLSARVETLEAALRECIDVMEPMAKYPKVNPWLMQAKAALGGDNG